MKLRGRRALGIFLAVVMVFTGMPTFFNVAPVYAQDPTDASAFTFDESTGTITGYVDNDGPEDLIVPSTINDVTVQAIGNNAFKYSTYSWSTKIKNPLKSLVLPDTIVNIKEGAFSGNEIETLAIPSSVQTIDRDAFSGNDKLATLTFAEGSQLTEIGREGFADCALAGQLSIPEGVTTLGNACFRNNKITEISLPDTLTRMDGRAFAVNGIEKATFPENLTELNKGNYSSPDSGIFFRNLKDFDTEDLRFTVIEDRSGNATNVNTRGIVNPAKVTFKYLNAANDEPIMPEVTAVGQRKKDIEKDGYDANIIPGDMAYLENYDNPHKDLTILYNRADYFEPIADNYYVRGKEQTFTAPAKAGFIPVEQEVTKTLTESENEVVFKYNETSDTHTLSLVGDKLTSNPEAGEILAGTQVEITVNIPDFHTLSALKVNDVNVLAQSMEGPTYTYKFVMTEDVTVEPEFTEQSPFIFDEETGTITGYESSDVPVDLVIPETIYGVTVKHIGYEAFKYSSYGTSPIRNPLKSLTLPDSLESIGVRAFLNSELAELQIPSSLQKISERSFMGNKTLKKVVFPENSVVTELEEYCFSGDPIEEINLPEGLTKIDRSALEGNNLTNLDIPSTVTEIQIQAFGNSTIEQLTLPAGIEKLGLDNNGRTGNGILYRTYPDANRNTFRFATVTDTSGLATIENTHAIVNPAKVKFKFINTKDNSEIQDAVEAVGIERKKLKVAGYSAELIDGSGDYLTNYELDHANYKAYTTFRDDIMVGNYFYKGKEESFETPDIPGYEKVSGTLTKTLEGGTNVVEFQYQPIAPPTLTVEGEGVTTTPEAGEVPSGTQVAVKVLEPSNKKLTAFNVNGVDKLSEMTTNGVAYSWKFAITEDTTLEPVYEDTSYEKEFEVTWNNMYLALGDDTAPTVKYRDKVLDSEAYTLEFDDTKAKLTDEGAFKPLVAGDVEATITLKDRPELTESTTFNVDDVTVQMRMEDEYATVLKPTVVVIDKLYVTEGVDYWKDYTFDVPAPALAIAKVAKEKNIATVTDRDDFNLGTTLNWMMTIGKDKFSYAEDGYSGSFMYDVNNNFVDLGVGEQPLHDGDIVRVYYQSNWMDNNAALYFEEEEFEVFEGESVDFKLFGYKKLPPAYQEVERKPYAGAYLEIDPETEGILAAVSDEASNDDGEVSYTFTEAGSYHISAVDIDAAIVRPYAHVVVKELPADMQTVFEDTEKGVKVELNEAIDANKYALKVDSEAADADEDYSQKTSYNIAFVNVKTDEEVDLETLLGDDRAFTLTIDTPEGYVSDAYRNVAFKVDGSDLTELEDTYADGSHTIEGTDLPASYLVAEQALDMQTVFEDNEKGVKVELNEAIDAKKYALKVDSEVADADEDYSQKTIYNVTFIDIATDEEVALDALLGEDRAFTLTIATPDGYASDADRNVAFQVDDSELTELDDTYADGSHAIEGTDLPASYMVAERKKVEEEEPQPEKEKTYVHVSVNNVNAFYGLNLKAPKGVKVSDLTWKSWNKGVVTVNQKGRITGKKAGMTRVVGTLETEEEIVQYHYFVRVLPGRVSNLEGKLKGQYVYLSGNTPERIHGVRLYRAKKNSKGEYLYKYLRAYKYRGRSWKNKSYQPRGGRYGYAVKAYRVMPLYKRNAKGYYEKSGSKTFWGYMSQRRVYASRR